MTDTLETEISQLESFLNKLQPDRKSDAFINDLYEALYYWCELGRWALGNNTRVNFQARARGEMMLMGRLQGVLRDKPLPFQQRFERPLEISARVLARISNIPSPIGGHLGFLQYAREYFSFLSDRGYSIIKQEPTIIRFSSGKVFIELQCSSEPWSSCLFGQDAPKASQFSIEDLLFLYGDIRYKGLPEKLTMRTESDVQEWIKFLSELFAKYGSDVVNDSPGIFERLAVAQSTRDAEFAEKMNRLYPQQ